MHRISRSTLVAVACLVVLALAAPEIALAQSNDRHVFTFGKVPKNFERRVERAGGSVLRSHPEIGVVVTTGLNDDDAAGLGGNAAPDAVLQWTPDLTQPRVQQIGGPGGTAHDPTDAFFFDSDQWDMRIINADDAWDAGFTGSPNVRVAVIDSGIDPFHQDLAGLIDTSASVAFVPWGAGIFAPPPGMPLWADDRFHGTHVAGTIVTHGIGTSGVAPHTTLIAVKALDVFGSGSFSDIIAGIVHSANVGADVINMSLGALGGVPKNLPGASQLIAALNKAVNYANRNGALVVSAAGNSASDMQHSGKVAFVPCESGSSVCVSATGPADMLAGYSNYGNTINVAAPGGDYAGNNSTDSIFSPCSSVSLFSSLSACSTGTFYLWLDGTSMAAPHVAGAAALLDAQAGGGMTPAQLRAALQQSATDLGKKGADPIYGKGRIDVCRLVGCE